VAATPTPESYLLAVRTLAIAGDRGEAAVVLERGLREFPADAGLRRLGKALQREPGIPGTPR